MSADRLLPGQDGSALPLVEPVSDDVAADPGPGQSPTAVHGPAAWSVPETPSRDTASDRRERAGTMGASPQQPRFRGIRPTAMSMGGGGAVVTALTMAHAPWGVVAAAVSVTVVASLVLGLATIVLPEESEHKLNLLVEFIRHRERRAIQRGRAAGGGRTRS